MNSNPKPKPNPNNISINPNSNVYVESSTLNNSSGSLVSLTDQQGSGSGLVHSFPAKTISDSSPLTLHKLDNTNHSNQFTNSMHVANSSNTASYNQAQPQSQSQSLSHTNRLNNSNSQTLQQNKNNTNKLNSSTKKIHSTTITINAADSNNNNHNSNNSNDSSNIKNNNNSNNINNSNNNSVSSSGNVFDPHLIVQKLTSQREVHSSLNHKMESIRFNQLAIAQLMIDHTLPSPLSGPTGPSPHENSFYNSSIHNKYDNDHNDNGPNQTEPHKSINNGIEKPSTVNNVNKLANNNNNNNKVDITLGSISNSNLNQSQIPPTPLPGPVSGYNTTSSVSGTVSGSVSNNNKTVGSSPSPVVSSGSPESAKIPKEELMEVDYMSLWSNFRTKDEEIKTVLSKIHSVTNNIEALHKLAFINLALTEQHDSYNHDKDASNKQ